jgi:choline dehydrogenase-like flavoprotein
MFMESNDIAPGQLIEAGTCIIGAGAAGIALARDLGRSGRDVLLLEAGGRREEPASQARYAGSVTDARLHSPPDRYRQRRFGGTSTIWGGRCMPFDPIDFEARDWIPHSGWPIGREALDRYYPRANEMCEAGAFEYRANGGADSGPVMRPMIKGFEGGHFSTDTLERFSRPTDFGRRYGRWLGHSAAVRVLLHSNVRHVQLDADGQSVDHLVVAAGPGREYRVRARQYVLAAGGLESARILLASRDVHPEGIGNHHDVLGRYYMCHLAGTIGALQVLRPREAVWHGYERDAEGVYMRRRLALRPQAQRDERLGNFVARLHHPRIGDAAHGSAMLSLLFLLRPIIPYEYAKRLYEADAAEVPLWPHVRNTAGAPLEAAGFAWHLFSKRILASRKFPSIIVRSPGNRYSVDFHAEQEPNPASRVQLAHERDDLGLPRLQVDWRYTAGDVHTVAGSLRLLQGDFAATGAARLDFEPASVEYEMTRYGAYGGHHIGTLRMGSDPRRSMVDADCRVHGVGNLHVAGAATFPTSSQANPTLTIVALALRLADHLKELQT